MPATESGFRSGILPRGPSKAWRAFGPVLWRHPANSTFISLQVFVGVILILAPCSPNYVWNELTVSPVYLSPANAAVLYVYGASVTAGYGVTPIVMASYTLLGGVLGTSLGMGLSYLVYLINEYSFEPTAVKVIGVVTWRRMCVPGLQI